MQKPQDEALGFWGYFLGLIIVFGLLNLPQFIKSFDTTEYECLHWYNTARSHKYTVDARSRANELYFANCKGEVN